MSPVYATYIQVTRTSGVTAAGEKNVARKQWVVIPPRPERDDLFLLFTREQATQTARPQWKHHFVGYGDLVRDLPDKFSLLAQMNVPWDGPLIVTAQLNEVELRQLHASPATPYKLLRRFEKVARAKYGVQI